MLNLSDISSLKENRGILPIEAYRNIRPQEITSKEDAVNFWKGEFGYEKNDASEDSMYERLFSEAFNRYEDEIDISFDPDDEVLSLLNQFNELDWSVLDEGTKLVLMENLVSTVGERLGIKDIPEISLYNEEDGAYGDYSPLRNIISINMDHCKTPFEIANTLLHELRHAYQHFRADLFETWEDALYRFNFDNYISIEPLPGGGCLFFYDYYNQYVEVEARAFANKLTGVLNE